MIWEFQDKQQLYNQLSSKALYNAVKIVYHHTICYQNEPDISEIYSMYEI